MKKKILSIALVVAMLAIAVAGGTLAYLTDTDHAMNTMTTGNVEILQEEWMRTYDENGEFTGITEYVNDAQKLIPSVYHNEDGSVANARPANWATDEVIIRDGKGANMPTEEVIANQIDKIVNVVNDGTEALYARTIFLFQTDDGSNGGKVLGDKIAINWLENGTGEQDTGHYNWLTNADGSYPVFTIDGKQYIATVHYYGDAIEAGETSQPSLTSFWMPGTKYDNADLPDDGYSVLAFSQAVQEEGFYDDHSALDAAFGEFTEANINAWLVELGY